ncbi:MAG: FxLYD domain-containing protein [Candidatus Bathyarchaeia archaeon]
MKKTYLSIILLILLVPLFDQRVQVVRAVAQARILPNHSGYLDFTNYPSPTYHYHVVGEVENTGTTSLYRINVTVNFYDANNIIIGSRSSYTLLNILLPGRKAPFEVVFAGENANQIQNYTLSLQFSTYTGEKPLALQILKSIPYMDEAGFQRVNGTIKNLGAENATNVKVVATFYDGNGKVAGVSYTYTMPSAIMPNQTAPFELILYRKGLYFPNYDLTAESSEYALVPELHFTHLFSPIIIYALITVLVCRKYKKKNHASTTPTGGENA